MTNVTRFDRYNIKTMRAEVEAALNGVAAKYGLVIGVGRITFTANDFRAKITAVTKSSVPTTPNGAPVVDPRRALEAAALKNNLWRLGLQEADLAAWFTDGAVRDRCQFIGYAPRRHKYPFTIRTSRGKTLKVGESLAKQIAAKKVA